MGGEYLVRAYVRGSAQNCRAYIDYIEGKLGVKAAIVSVGPKREETIILKDLF